MSMTTVACRNTFWNKETLFDDVPPGDALAPELEEVIEWIEQGDYVRIERLVRRDDAPAQFGFIVRTNPEIQWALVRFEHSRRMEWFWIDEVFLVLKAAALAAPANAEAANA